MGVGEVFQVDVLGVGFVEAEAFFGGWGGGGVHFRRCLECDWREGKRECFPIGKWMFVEGFLLCTVPGSLLRIALVLTPALRVFPASVLTLAPLMGLSPAHQVL
jgi:hypothetical protein